MYLLNYVYFFGGRQELKHFFLTYTHTHTHTHKQSCCFPVCTCVAGYDRQIITPGMQTFPGCVVETVPIFVLGQRDKRPRLSYLW